MNSANNIIPDEGIFNYLTPEEKRTLGSSSTYVNFSRHDVLFKQNMPSDHAIYVLNGLIKVYSGGRSSRLICISLYGPGGFAGLPSVLSSGIYMNSASAIEDTGVLMLRKDAVKNLVRSNGGFALALASIVGKENLTISDKLVNFSMKQLPGRVADLIRYFADEIFKSDSFTVPLTRQELAELIGTTKESLIRTLIEFKNDKIIELDGRDIKIISKDLIKILSEIG